jgi:hypothetical protein
MHIQRTEPVFSITMILKYSPDKLKSSFSSFLKNIGPKKD